MAYLLQQQARRLAYYPPNSNSSSGADAVGVNGVAPATIKRVSASSPLSQLVAVLEEDGCVVVKGFTSASTITAAQRELAPWLERLSAAEEEEKHGEDGP